MFVIKKQLLSILLAALLMIGGFTACKKADEPSSEELQNAENRAIYIFKSRRFETPKVTNREYEEDVKEYVLSVSLDNGEAYEITVDMSSKDDNGNYNKINIEKK